MGSIYTLTSYIKGTVVIGILECSKSAILHSLAEKK